MQLLILGEHDKGLGVPFSPVTTSGRRLRRMLDELALEAELENAFTWDGEKTVVRDIAGMARGRTVVALGRVAAAECGRQGVAAIYLPHPAVRSSAQLEALRGGLAALCQPDSRAGGDCATGSGP